MATTGWIVVLFAVWALWVAQSTTANWVAGAAAAILAGLAARLLAARGLHAYTFRRDWLAVLGRALWQVPADTVIVLRVLARAIATGNRKGAGRFVAQEFDAGGRTVRGTSWRALAAYAASWSPNSYVVEINQERKFRIAHDLRPRRATEDPT